MMQLLRPPTVNSKLLVLTLLTSSVALLLAAGIYTVYQLSALRHELVHDVSVLAQVVAAQGRQALAQGDRGAMDEALSVLREDRTLVAAHVFAVNGRSVAGFGTPATAAVFEGGFSTPMEVFQDRHLIMTRPILQAGESIGTVLLESDLGPLYARLTEQAGVGALVMLLSFAAAFALSMRMRRQIAGPLDALAASAREAGSARLWESPPPAPGDDELTGLMQAFHGMLDALRRRDAALRDSEQRYRALVENAAEAVLLFDPTGRIVDANRQACLDLGYTRDELLQRDAGALDMEACENGIARWCRGDGAEMPATFNVIHQRKDRSVYPAEVRLARYEEGGQTWLLALSRDVSERDRAAREVEKARAAAESANRTKTRFLANINHEIRTPMTSVLAMSELLDRSTLDPEQRRYVTIVRSSADSLLAVIDDILELSWTDSGRLALDSLSFDIEPLVDDVLELFAQRARGKGIELASLVEAGVPRALRGDPKHLRQVLINLLGNAVKFTERGEIELRVQALDVDGGRATLRFTVRDTGIGIPRELHGELFEPFAQQDSSTTRRHGGAGIGLTISRALVELMDGTIGVDSEPDAGSEFWFTVTLDVDGAAAVAPVHELECVRALLVEGNGAVRGALSAQLRAVGLVVDAVESAPRAEAALASARRAGESHDLLFAGLAADGSPTIAAQMRDLVRTVRTTAAGDVPTVIALTPIGDGAGGAQELDADARLTKPVRQSGLAGFVRSVVRGEVSPPVVSAIPQVGEGARVRVLVVDDDAAIRTSLSLVLEVLGYAARSVSNGLEALQALENGRYDVVLMDCQMPVMDGFDAVRALREREAGRSHVPVIGITAYVHEGERERCLEAGMDELLAKPISITVLESVLASHVANRATH